MVVSNLEATATLCRVRTDGAFEAGEELFSILADLFNVRFSTCEEDGTGSKGELIFQSGNTIDGSIGATSTPRLIIPLPHEQTGNARMKEVEVTFMDDADVPYPFRGRTVTTKVPDGLACLPLAGKEKVLASSEAGPLWTMSVTSGARHFKSALPLPDASSNHNFSDVFNGLRFLEMLPALQFLREVVAYREYTRPPLRATFVIDDPNLHWPRYGYVDYHIIAAHARAGEYHVSFATIPLDTWYTHGKTAALFRENGPWLSLLVHGNNHGREELGRKYPEATRRGLLIQAIRRIERLERQANLRVCRVMVPPHGACSGDMLADLPEYGFESACISAGSLRAHNRNKRWTRTLGFLPSEIVEGCPVLPRWGLSGDVKTALLVAVYLGQPMILRGHHQDLKHGMEVLDEHARFINGLGRVLWSSMTQLSRMNYVWRMEGTTCYVRPLGRRVRVDLPRKAREVVIEAPAAIGNCGWHTVLSDGSVRRVMVDDCVLLPENVGPVMSVERDAKPQPDLSTVNTNLTSGALIVRRLLTEARDRLWVS